MAQSFDGHHPDPEAILHDLIPTNDEDGPRGHDAHNLLEVATGRPLEQDNRPPASFGLGGLENQLGVPLELGVQLQGPGEYVAFWYLPDLAL